MRSLLYFVVGVVQVVACAQSPGTTRNEEMKRFAKEVAERALDFSEGNITSLKDAQDDFTSDGWNSFLELEQIPNDTAAPEFSSEFTASADPMIIKDQAGAVGLGIPGELKQSRGPSRTSYRVVVYLLTDNESRKIKVLEVTTCGGASSNKPCEVNMSHAFPAH